MNKLPLEIIYRHIYIYIPAYHISLDQLINKYYEIKILSIIKKIVYSKFIIKNIKKEIQKFNFKNNHEYIYENENIFLSIKYKKKKKDYIIIYY